MRVRFVLIVMALSLLLTVGCGQARPVTSSETKQPSAAASATPPVPGEVAVSATQTPSGELVPLSSDGSGALAGVGIGPYGPFGTMSGSADDKAAQRGLERVAIKVFDSLRGIETYLVVPMYYDGSTTLTYRGSDESVPVAQAVADKDRVWSESPVTDVKFHLDNGVLVLDSIVTEVRH